MAIDWVRLFEAHGVEYVESGKNVKSGEINIRCPLCADDPSHHLGISLEKGFWSCWRDRSHSGKRPHRLLMRLLSLSYAAVERLIADAPSLPDGFENFVQGLSQSAQEEVKVALEVPLNFAPIRARESECGHHLGYLRNRGLSADACAFFDLRYCLWRTSPWFDRVIVPYSEFGRVVAWTARGIRPRQMRYLSSSPKTVPGSLATSSTLYNIDSIGADTKTLVVTEGPFDAMNVHWCGRGEGIGSVALSTLSPSERQLAMLVALTQEHRFDSMLVALDRGASAQADAIVRELTPFGNVRRFDLPGAYEDPAELPRKEVIKMARS